MSDILSPLPVQRFVDSNGNALVGGKLFTYAAGTTTKIATYTDFSGGTPNTNPIILNSRGEANVWLPPQTVYKFVLSPSTDTDPPTNPIWTVDNINSSAALAGATSTLPTIAALRANTISDGTGPASIVVQEYASGDFVGGGLFALNPSDVSSVDNGGTIIVDAIGQRWYRITYGVYHPVDFGADPTGTSDSTTSLQNCINAAYTAGGKVLIDNGTFLTTGVVVYNTQTIEFTPSGLLRQTSGGACIRTQVSPGAGPPSATTITTLKLIKPNIDLNSQAGTAILFDCCAWCTIDTPTILNVPSGNWTYTSFAGAVTLPASGIVILATPHAAFAYYNIILTPHLMNPSAANNGVGIYYGDQSDSSGFPNVNRVIGGRISNFVTGVYVHSGSDGLIDRVDVSENTTGIMLGDDTGPKINRYTVLHPYMENCTNGIVVSIQASRCIIDGIGSVSGTTNPIVFNSGSSQANAYVINWMTDYTQSSGGIPGGSYQIAVDPNGTSGGVEIACPEGVPPILAFTNCQGSFSAKTATLSGDVLGRIQCQGAVSSSAFATSTLLQFNATENWSPTANGTDFVVFTVAQGSTTQTKNLTIAQEGSFTNTGFGQWNTAPPSAQPTPTGNTATVTAGVGATVKVDTTFTGGEGSNAYTIGDLVKALKNTGQIAT